jgi:MFS family permease
MEKSPERRHPPTGGRALAALALAMLLASLGISIATVAMPTLARSFGASLPAVQWVVLAYLLSVTAFIVTGGRLGDLFGHRRVLLAGLVTFIAASALCGAAPSLGLLIAARVAQGIGGAVLMALPISIVRETVATERTGTAMGLLGTMSAIGTALGPSLGGMLIAGLGWRAAFLALAAFGAVVLVIALRTIPGGARPAARHRPRLDLPGAALLAVSLGAYALAVTGEDGVTSARGALLVLAAAGAAAAFIRVERRSSAPLVPLPAVSNPAIASSLFMNLLVSTGMMATLVVGPFYLTFALGLNEAHAGLVMAVGPAIAALAGVPAGKVTDRYGAPCIMVVGLAEMMAGFTCLAFLPDLLGVWGYGVSLAVLTPGFQLFLAANNTTAMMAASDDQRGMVSGLLGLSRNLGFMTGASVMGAVFAAAAGTRDIAHALPDTIGKAFSVTFVLAAGLMALSILVARAGHGATVRAQR